MKYASVCSGIGAPECAWSELEGWHCQFAAEIERFPSAVYAHHFPNVPNLGDITRFREWPDYPISILVGGTPCQSFSVAGLRAGLADPRGNLALTFLAIAERYRPQWVVWENVPGVHSSWSDAANRGPTQAACAVGENARRLAKEAGFDALTASSFGFFEEVDQSSDFDCFLSGLAELGYGVASRIFDAQYFDLAQRRERVFVVGCAGGQWQRAAAVLFERESLCGHPAPRRQAGQRTAPTISARTKGGGALGSDAECDGAVIPIQEIGKRQSGTPQNGVGHGADGDPMFTLQSTAVHGVCATLTKNYATHSGRSAGNNGGVAENQLVVAHALKADGFDASEDGTGRGVPIVIAHGQANAEILSDGSPSLSCNHEAPIVFTSKDYGADAGEISPTLRAAGHSASHANAGAPPAIAFQSRIARNGRGDMGELVNALQADSGKTGKGDAAPCVALTSCSEPDTVSHADATETDTVKTLRALREEIGEEAFSQWGLGILASFWPQEILRPAVHGTSLRCPTLEEFGLVHYASSRPEAGAERFVREMREAQRQRCAPFGWKSHEQPTQQLAAYLSQLSQPGASGAQVLRDLRCASQGVRVLRSPLSAVQEVGRSAAGEGQSVQPIAEGERGESNPALCSAALWESVSRQWVLWKARNTAPAGKTGYAIRRLSVTECEFLMGFPRNWTAIPYRGKPAADGPRYRALGNSMAVPVLRWIGQRIELMNSL